MNQFNQIIKGLKYIGGVLFIVSTIAFLKIGQHDINTLESFLLFFGLSKTSLFLSNYSKLKSRLKDLLSKIGLLLTTVQYAQIGGLIYNLFNNQNLDMTLFKMQIQMDHKLIISTLITLTTLKVFLFLKKLNFSVLTNMAFIISQLSILYFERNQNIILLLISILTMVNLISYFISKKDWLKENVAILASPTLIIFFRSFYYPNSDIILGIGFILLSCVILFISNYFKNKHEVGFFLYPISYIISYLGFFTLGLEQYILQASYIMFSSILSATQPYAGKYVRACLCLLTVPLAYDFLKDQSYFINSLLILTTLLPTIISFLKKEKSSFLFGLVLSGCYFIGFVAKCVYQLNVSPWYWMIGLSIFIIVLAFILESKMNKFEYYINYLKRHFHKEKEGH